MVYRNIEFTNEDVNNILDNRAGWGIFPNTTEGSHAAIALMGGDDVDRYPTVLSWDGGGIHFITAASKDAWGKIPNGVSPLTVALHVISDTDEDKAQYEDISEGESVTDFVFNKESEIIGSLYIKKEVDDENDDTVVSISVISDRNIVGRAMFAVEEGSELLDKAIKFYTTGFESIIVDVLETNTFVSQLSSSTFAASVNYTLEKILTNKGYEESTQLNPTANLEDWYSLIPYTSDAIPILLYLPLNPMIEREVAESASLKAPDGIVPWNGASFRFVISPPTTDSRAHLYSPIIVGLERNVASLTKCVVVEEGNLHYSMELSDGEWIDVRYGAQVSVDDELPSSEESVHSHNYIISSEQHDFLLSMSSISNDPEEPFMNEVLQVTRNIIEAIKGAGE